MEIHKNTRLRKVERPGSKDRYGRMNYETIYSKIPCRLVQKTRFVRNTRGDELMIDATVWFDQARLKFQVGDRLTLDNATGDTYNVFSVNEHQDVDGVTAYTTCLLTKQK